MFDSPSFDTLYNKTLRFLSFRPRSEKEVFDYLVKKLKAQNSKRKTITENSKALDLELVSQIMKKLREYKFVDDLAFAKWFIENRKKGKRLVLLELSQKGISKEIIEEVASTLDLVKKEEDLLEKLIDKKWKTYSRKEGKAYERIMGFLLRRGFDYETAKKAVKERIKSEISVDD